MFNLISVSSVYTGNALRSPGLRNGLVQDSIAQESIQYSSAPDSSEAAAAIFQQVGMLILVLLWLI